MVAELRSATSLDADAVAAVHVAAWRAAYRDSLTVEVLARVTVEARAAQWREWLDRAAASPSSSRTWLAREGRDVVAFASTGPCRDDGEITSCAEIYAIYVKPDRWRRGLGRALFDRCVEHAQTGASSALTLWVAASNTRARTFYEARGMESDGRTMFKTAFGVKLPEVRYRMDLAPRRA